MKREDLRKVTWTTNEYDGKETKLIKNKGYFHEWFTDYDHYDGFQVTTHLAIVEKEDGKVICISSDNIKFL